MATGTITQKCIEKMQVATEHNKGRQSTMKVDNPLTQGLAGNMSSVSSPPAVLPSLAVFPTEVGLHSGETLRLRCSASGFPRPGVVWAAADDVRINLQLRPQLTAEDDVTVQSDMVIKNAHPDMSGSYICAACHSEWNGQCEMTEELQKMFVSVAVYGKTTT